MPDIINATKFQSKMYSTEQAYLNQIAAYRSETRRVLLDVIDRDGVSRAAINQIMAELGDLQRRVAGAAAATSRDIRRNVQNYTRKQIELAKRVGLADSADLSPVLNRGAQVAQDGEQSYMTSTPAWLQNLETSIQTNAAKLRMSQADNQAIVDRLLNERLADGRASVWLANGNQQKSEETTNLWSYGVGLLGAYIAIYNDTAETVEYKKQAIATIDERTTDCCLQVHGQIQNIDDPFHLTGTPRFADEVQDPPFFYYCRTSEALYHEKFEQVGVTTARMEEMAAVELEARKDGSRMEIYPSSATSRRPQMPRANDRF